MEEWLPFYPSSNIMLEFMHQDWLIDMLPLLQEQQATLAKLDHADGQSEMDKLADDLR